MDLRSGLRLLRERWRLILVVALLATMASGFLTWRETPQYASQATLFVSAWGNAADSTDAYQGSLLSHQKVKSYTELLRGQRVMAAVVDSLDLDLTPKQLAGKVASATIRDTSLLTVTVRDPSPTRAQQVASAITDEFIALVPSLEGETGNGQPVVRVTVASAADLPASPASPRPLLNLAAAAMLGALAGFALAMARRALDTTVKTVEQTEETGGIPSLGTIAYDPTIDKHPLTRPATHSPRAEGYRKVRTNLQFVDVDRPHQALLVTSAMPGEGKSLTACNLAAVLAEAEKQVILVDGDLRRPTAARYLGLPNGVGLTSVLLGQLQLADATQRWGGGRFAVLTSGPIPPNPATLLASQRLRGLLDELRATYDMIIIDSPPTLPVADATALAAACDGVAVVVRHGKTRHEQLRSTVRTLQNAGTPILGTLLNQAPHQRSSYYTYDYRAPGQQPRSHENLIPKPAPAHQ